MVINAIFLAKKTTNEVTTNNFSWQIRTNFANKKDTSAKPNSANSFERKIS